MIRRANHVETRTLLHLTADVMNESSMGYSKGDYNQIVDMFRDQLDNGGYYLIALDRNTIQGWILIGPDFNPIHNMKTGVILSLYVFPKYRKLGIGKMLMKFALNDFKLQGYKKVQLNVFSGNPAKNLYKQLGFRNIATTMELKLD